MGATCARSKLTKKKEPSSGSFLFIRQLLSLPPRPDICKASVEAERRDAVVWKNSGVIVAGNVLVRVDIEQIVCSNSELETRNRAEGSVDVGNPFCRIALIEGRRGTLDRDFTKPVGVYRPGKFSVSVIQRQVEVIPRLANLDSGALDPVKKHFLLAGELGRGIGDPGDFTLVVVEAGCEAADARTPQIQCIAADNVDTIGFRVDGVGEIPSATYARKAFVCKKLPYGRTDEVSGKHDPVVDPDVIIISGQREITERGHRQTEAIVDRLLRLQRLGAEDHIAVWDTATGKEVRSFRGHEEGVTSLAISPDGQTAAAGSEDRTIVVWDLLEG